MIIGFGLVAGLAIGLGLAELVLPVTSLAQDGGSTYPPVEVSVPWWRVTALVAGVAAAAVLGVGAALGLRSRASTGSSLRTGVER